MKLTAFYGELYCPQSMIYAEGLVTVLEVKLNPDYDNMMMQQLLADIDTLIKSRLEVTP